MAAVVDHAMRRYPTSPPSSSYPSHCLGGEGSHQDTWSHNGIRESSLSRSMRYAEPWLYGSVRGPPGLLLAPALVLCSCSEYLNGTKRPSKKGPTLCKKCKGTRLPFPNINDTLRGAAKFGTVRCYPTTSTVPVASPPLRSGTVRVTSHSRPSILPSTDPYELVRRSRLSPENGTQFRIRATSPSKTVHNEPQQTFSAPKSSTVVQKSLMNGRRSILECDINPYDLMSTETTSNVTPISGQRVKVRASPSSDQEYEEVKVQSTTPRQHQPSQIPKLKISNTHKPKGPSKSNEKECDSSRFKSILKKPTTFSDTDSSGGPERSPSPAHKSGSHFYLPMPINTPRKKVQFLVENELLSQKQIEEKNCSSGDDSNNEQSEGEANIYEEVPECSEDDLEKKSLTLGRSTSERLTRDPAKVVFHDTMALRTRSRRSDLKDVFNGFPNLRKVDGIAPRRRSLSPPSLRSHLPPSTPSYSTESSNNQKCTTVSINEVAEEMILPDSNSEDVVLDTKQEEVNQNNINTKSSDDLANTPPSVPPRKRSNNKVSTITTAKESVMQKSNDSVAIKVDPQNSVSIMNGIETETSKVISITDDNNKSSTTNAIKVESPVTDYRNRTVVQINAPSAIHKIQIKNEFPELNNVQTVTISDNAQRKTSIMITGDDCYSTVNVNDDVPMYQSSVVVKDTGSENDIRINNRSSSIYITGNFASPSSDSVSSPNKRQFLENSNYNNKIALKISKPDEPSESCPPKDQETSSKRPNLQEHNANTLKQISSTDDFKKFLQDPVEAVKRNLVPHVCGKSDVSRRPRDRKLTNFANSLLESSFECNINNFIEDSLLKLKNYESCGEDDKDMYSDYSSSTQYETMDPGSDSYTDNSNRSSVTEEELNARTKFYEMLADSAIAEISETEDHHYESIRLGNDPIYEEITPPPLPSNPPPSSIIDDLQIDKQFTTRSIFEGASKYDILSYLVDAKERGIIPEDTYHFGNSEVVIEEDCKEAAEQYRVSHMSSVSDSSEDSSLVITNSLPDEKSTFQKSAEVERNDSGVGSETSKSSLSRFRTKSEPALNCEDCETPVESQSENEPLICRKCLKKRSERKEIITEIVETEEKYSRDLQIILEEFYQPMLVAGLLSPEQLAAIFLNAEELLENSQALAERLRDAVEIAVEQGDEDLLTVNIGKLFLEAAPMLHGFETYCIRQGNASLLLASLEKEKELLRIFLRVSQMENTMLRRMNLNSFLMVPVQRVTKYPLLLNRLYKSTPLQHETRDQLKEAQHKIELHLNHMNSETKDVPSKLWRRIGNNSGRRSSSEMDLVSIKLRKIAVDVLEWNHDEAKFALEGKLLFTQPTDNNWRKGRTIKLTPINALLVTNGKQMFGNRTEEDSLTFPRNGIREAALLLVRDKNGRYSLLREPLYLDRCVIATDQSWQSYFEVQEVIGKDTFIFKAEDDDLTRMWYRTLQFHAQGLGGWRKRRNALANIMINGMGLRS